MPMPKETFYAVNGSGGAFVDIPCTIPCRSMTIEECPDAAGVFNPQGLQYQRSEDSFASTKQGISGDVIRLGDNRAAGGRDGAIIGWPAQSPASGGSSNKSADVPLKVKSLTVTATKVKVTEWP